MSQRSKNAEALRVRIRRLAKSKKHSQKAIGERLGVSQAYVWKVLKSEANDARG